MRFMLKKYETNKTFNIRGKTISSSNYYLIVVLRLLRRRRYLRLLPEWQPDFFAGEPVNVEITKDPKLATKFYDDASANTPHLSTGKDVINKIKSNPDRFILS